MSTRFSLQDEARTRQLGAVLARYRPDSALIHLSGDLGAGKTTLARGFIQACGHPGQVKSPTYTLMESYALPNVTIHHLDLYRLADPEELEYLGLDELEGPGNIALVEWPERGEGVLPAASLSLHLAHRPNGREVMAIAHNPEAQAWLTRVAAHFD
jgi:tRNA threonylcarbamoyladenosine biosynthesis protein TsaE